MQRDVETKQRELKAEHARLTLRQAQCGPLLTALEAKVAAARAQLAADPTYVQLHALENKWQLLEKSNYAVRELLLAKEAEADFKPYVVKVTGLIKVWPGARR